MNKLNLDSKSKSSFWLDPSSIGEMSLLGKLTCYFSLLLWAFIVLFPIYWLVITAFKSMDDVNFGPVFVPWLDFTPSLHAWKNIILDDMADTLSTYTNSIVISFFSTIICVIVGSLAAYAIARIEYKPKFGSIALFALVIAASCVAIGRWGIDWWIGITSGLAVYFFLWRESIRKRFNSKTMMLIVGLFILLALVLLFSGNYFSNFDKHGITLFIILILIMAGLSAAYWINGSVGNSDILFWVISQRILPPVVVVLPVYIMFQRVGLLDTHFALIVAYAVVNLPIVVWLMHDFIATIPIDLEESAQLDGSSKFGIFWEIVLPLTRPGLAATTLLTLILSWNEYLLSAFLSTSKAQTMPIMVSAQITMERGIQWWNMSVVIILMIIPVIIMAFLLQRFISKGVLLGAVKG